MGKRRIVLRVGIFLLLGAIINVAVAGALVSYAHRFAPGDFGTLALDPTGFAQPTPWHKQLPSPVNGTYSVHATGRFGFRFLNAWVSDANLTTVAECYWECIGWPLFTMQRLVPVIEVSRRVRSAAGAGRWLGTDFAANQVVPIGFAINTIFYAAIVWMLFAMPGHIKRKCRIKRGLCSGCGYPVGTSPMCTECGAMITARRT